MDSLGINLLYDIETAQTGSSKMRYRVGEMQTDNRDEAADMAMRFGLHVRCDTGEQWYWTGSSWEGVPAPVEWQPEGRFGGESGHRRVTRAWAQHQREKKSA